MPNLWTRIHRAPAPIPLEGAEAFDVSEILRMFWEGPDDILNWEKLPNVAPPFRSYFMFGYAPVQRTQGLETQVQPGCEQGALFQATSSVELGGWNLTAAFVGGSSNHPLWQEFMLAYHVGPGGALERFENGKMFAVIGPRDFEGRARARGLTAEDVVTAISGLAFPYLMATSILHCRNVTARRVSQSDKLARAAAKRGNPIYSYSVLDVSPARRVLRDEGGMGGAVTLAKALHVCRGHFKDYRDGVGLFGKAKGMYWWQQSLRGDVRSGVHVKDYKVRR